MALMMSSGKASVDGDVSKTGYAHVRGDGFESNPVTSVMRAGTKHVDPIMNGFLQSNNPNAFGTNPSFVDQMHEATSSVPEGNHPGQAVNQRTTYARMPHDFSVEGENEVWKQLNKGMVTFTHRSDVDENNENFGSFHRSVMMPLPTLNRILLDQAVNSIAGEVPTPEDILEKWACEGVVVSDVFDEYNNLSTSTPVINNTVRNRANVFDVWGNSARFAGTKLYFIIKQYDIREIAKDFSIIIDVVNPSRGIKRTHEGTPAYDETRKRMVTQIVPWADAQSVTRKPLLKDMEYKDSNGQTRYGRYIYFGYVVEPPMRPRELDWYIADDTKMRELCSRDINFMIRRPNWPVHVDIHHEQL